MCLNSLHDLTISWKAVIKDGMGEAIYFFILWLYENKNLQKRLTMVHTNQLWIWYQLMASITSSIARQIQRNRIISWILVNSLISKMTSSSVPPNKILQSGDTDLPHSPPNTHLDSSYQRMEEITTTSQRWVIELTHWLIQHFIAQTSASKSQVQLYI